MVEQRRVDCLRNLAQLNNVDVHKTGEEAALARATLFLRAIGEKLTVHLKAEF